MFCLSSPLKLWIKMGIILVLFLLLSVISVSGIVYQSHRWIIQSFFTNVLVLFNFLGLFARNQGLTTAERKALRLEHALPILNGLSKWMVEQLNTALPKDPLGKALDYTLPRWDNLLAYLYDGHLEIDNNRVENAIRPLAIGRKNYLFAGSHDAAKRAAMFYSFFGTCKRHNINPYEWLKDVLERIPEHKANKLDELLPQNWKKS